MHLDLHGDNSTNNIGATIVALDIKAILWYTPNNYNPL